MEPQEILNSNAFNKSNISMSDKFLTSVFGYFSVEEPIGRSLKNIEWFSSEFADCFVIKRKCEGYWGTILTQRTIPQTILPFFKTHNNSSNNYTVKSLYLRDTLLLTDMHLYLQQKGLSHKLLGHIKTQLRSGIRSKKSAKHLSMILYVTCKLLLIDGYINGKFDEIASIQFNGEIVFLIANGFNAIYPWVKEYPFIFEPIVSLLAELFLYSFGCTKNKNKSENVHDIFLVLLKEQENISTCSSPAIDFCLSTIVQSGAKDSVVNIPQERCLPIQNLDIRLLLAACRLLLCILSVQNVNDECKIIEYIEHKARDLCPEHNTQAPEFPYLFSLIVCLLGKIVPNSPLSKDVISFLKETTVSLILCTKYDMQLLSFFNVGAENPFTSISELIEYIDLIKSGYTNTTDTSYTLICILSEVLHAFVLGDPIRRYLNKTLLIQSNLLPLTNVIGYFWCQQYHYMTTIYTDIIMDVKRDEYDVSLGIGNNTKEKSKQKRNLLHLSKQNVQIEYTKDNVHKVTIPVSWEFVNRFVEYDERDRLEFIPLIYLVSNDTKEILAIYIPSYCKILNNNSVLNRKILNYNRGEGKHNKKKFSSFSFRNSVEEDDIFIHGNNAQSFNIQMELHSTHYDIEHLYSLTHSTDASTDLFFHWYHPSVGLHIKIMDTLRASFTATYFNKSSDNTHIHRLFCLSDFSSVQLPSCSFKGYGYATVSSQPFSYIKDVLQEIYMKIYENYPSCNISAKLEDCEKSVDTKNKIVLCGATPDTKANVVVLKDIVLTNDGKKINRRKEFTYRTLRPSQFKALMYAALSPLTLILGCPGSGKSTTLAHISKMFILEEGANSKWIPVQDDNGNEKNRPKWNLFKDIFFSSIKTYRSVTEMVLSEDLGTQLFITAHSNNAADQLTRYILEMDGWHNTTLPFIVRLGTQSSDPKVFNFMPIYYLYKMALELDTELDKPYDTVETLKTGDILTHFTIISRKIQNKISSGYPPECYFKLTNSQKNILHNILKNIKYFSYQLLNSATILVSTTSGFGTYIRYINDIGSDDFDDLFLLDYPLDSDNYNTYSRSLYNQSYPFSNRFYKHTATQNSYGNIVDEFNFTKYFFSQSSPYNTANNNEVSKNIINNNRSRYLIVEEAARLPEHEFALFLVAPFTKIILLGDILQLPPLIQDQTVASSGALDWSAFHRICYSPQVNVPIVALEEQARSTPEIADLYRSLYESSLPKYCAIKGGLRDIPGIKFDNFVDQLILKKFRGRCFYIPNNNISKYTTHISDIDTKLIQLCQQMEEYRPSTQLENKDSENNKVVTIKREETNNHELVIIYCLLYSTLMKVRKMIFSESHLDKLTFDSQKQEYQLQFSVAILSLYKAQIALLESKKFIQIVLKVFKELKIPISNGRKVCLNVNISISTADAFQGLEADIVFLSMVKNNANTFIDNLPRALVSVSRARRLIVCIGAVETSKNAIWLNVVKQPTLDIMELLNDK